MSNYENYEHECNKALDFYFNARPYLERTIANEQLFIAGFRRAWDFLIKTYKVEVI